MPRPRSLARSLYISGASCIWSPARTRRVWGVTRDNGMRTSHSNAWAASSITMWVNDRFKLVRQLDVARVVTMRPQSLRSSSVGFRNVPFFFIRLYSWTTGCT